MHHRLHGHVGELVVEAVGGTAEAILGWLNGNVETTLEKLIDDLTTLWIITGDGAADHARQRLPATKP